MCVPNLFLLTHLFPAAQEIRKYLARIRADEALVLLLHQKNRQIVYGAAGVLVNIAPHVEGKDVLMWSNFEGVRNLLRFDI